MTETRHAQPPRRKRHLLAALGVIGATVAVHEAAHAVAASRAGGKVNEVGVGFGPPLLRLRLRGLPVVVRLLPMGGYAAVDAERIPPRRRIPMLLAGPLANIVAGVALLAAFRRHPVEIPTGGRQIGLTGFVGALAALVQAATQGPGALARLAGSINLGLGVMNLLPVYPMDGGHVALSLMEERGVSPKARSVFARLTGAAFLMIAQAAMLGDLRRLARNRDQGPGTR